MRVDTDLRQSAFALRSLLSFFQKTGTYFADKQWLQHVAGRHEASCAGIWHTSERKNDDPTGSLFLLYFRPDRIISPFLLSQTLEARGGIEPPIKALQAFALPLGDRAVKPIQLVQRHAAAPAALAPSTSTNFPDRTS